MAVSKQKSNAWNERAGWRYSPGVTHVFALRLEGNTFLKKGVPLGQFAEAYIAFHKHPMLFQVCKNVTLSTYTLLTA